MDDLFDSQRHTKTHNLIRWKSGKRVDPKLLGVLESFGEIFVERHEFFKKIFDEKYEELFEKIGSALKERKKMKKAKSMGRSMSMRAIGKRGGIDDDQVQEIEELRLDRFKVKTPNVIEEGQSGSGPTQGVPPTQGSSTDTK